MSELVGAVAPLPSLQVVETVTGSRCSWNGQGPEGSEISSHQPWGCLPLPSFVLLTHQALMKRSLCLIEGKKIHCNHVFVNFQSVNCTFLCNFISLIKVLRKARILLFQQNATTGVLGKNIFSWLNFPLVSYFTVVKGWHWKRAPISWMIFHPHKRMVLALQIRGQKYNFLTLLTPHSP